ncbi:MAG TPA: hypothetical protein VL137_03565 [Polyangiaceae bacterium]|nr:hypothetical protein [Polyangiaceae bacterium]
MTRIVSLLALCGAALTACGASSKDAAGVGGATNGPNGVGTGGNPSISSVGGNASASGGGGNATGGNFSGGASSGGALSGVAGLNTGGTAQGGSAGSSTSGTGGASGGAAGISATGGMPSGPPTGVNFTTHDVDVQGMGSVFNVADDYFNDGFIPPTPVANFGCQSQITVVQHDDGSLDVAWLDYTLGGGKPWALPTPGMINITHIDAALTGATSEATGIQSYKLLGFTEDASGAVYLAYNKDHALKTNAQDDENNINGNELHVVKLGQGGWDQLIFGDQDNNADATPGDPGGAASSVLSFDPTNNVLVLYLGHSMMWTPTRHQAGYLRLINPESGAVLPPAGDDILHFGAGWWYSHNFNQRLIIDGGNYYLLAHGDAFSRQLGFARWSLSGYTDHNDTDFNESYWAIAGNEGDNNTNAQTGQFARMADGRFVITHTTSEGRNARDVRVITASGTDGTADTAGAVWLTSNPADTHATMPKVELLGDQLLVTYALWPGSGHTLSWYAALLDSSLATVVAAKQVPNVEFVDSAPLFRFKGGLNLGNVGWVSGNATHTLTVGIASPSYQ